MDVMFWPLNFVVVAYTPHPDFLIFSHPKILRPLLSSAKGEGGTVSLNKQEHFNNYINVTEEYESLKSWSEEGEGGRFHLRLPFTLLIMRNFLSGSNKNILIIILMWLKSMKALELLSSEEGEGGRFLLRLPFTLLIMRNFLSGSAAGDHWSWTFPYALRSLRRTKQGTHFCYYRGWKSCCFGSVMLT